MLKEKIYHESGLESLQDRRWCRKLYLFYKVLKNENPKYLFILIPTRRLLCSTRNIHNTPCKQKTKFFQKRFFPSIVIQQYNLDPHYRKSESFQVFKGNIFKLITSSRNSVYNFHNPRGICLITRLRLGLIHLRKQNLNMSSKIR